MATVKNYLGFTECDNLTDFDINSLGESLSSLSNFVTYHNNLVPAPKINDLLIQKSNLILSFALSKNLLFEADYKKPVVFVTITGNNYKQEKETIRLYKGGQPGNNNISIKWDNIYYGILRVGITKEQVKEIVSIFNTISAIGIIIFDLVDDKPFGKLFELGTQSISSSEFQDICEVMEKDTGTLFDEKSAEVLLERQSIKQLSEITKYDTNPTSGSQAINNDIIIKPYYTIIDYDMIGYGEDSVSNYTNSSFFYKKVGFTLKTITHFNTTLYPMRYQFCSNQEFLDYNNQDADGKVLPNYNWHDLDNPLSFSISDFNPIYNTEATKDSTEEEKKGMKFLGLVYGGYTYLQSNFFNKLRHCSDVLNLWTEEKLSKYYSFEGDRKNRQFTKYMDPDTIDYYNYYIDGFFKYKQKIEFFPYTGFLEIGSDPTKTDTKVVNFNEKATLTKNGNSGGWVPNNAFGTTYKMTNNFTGDEETNWFNFVLKFPEVRYWKVGEKISKTTENSTIILSEDQKEEIICYNKENIDITEGVFIDTWADSFNTIEATLLTKDSKQPLEQIIRPDESSTISVEEQSNSYFQYIFMGIVDGTYETYYKLPYYTILYSKFLPKTTPILLSDENYFDQTNLKIQENKLFFKFIEGIGDYNDVYTNEQFINYAINEDRSIGLSQTGRNEQMKIIIKYTDRTSGKETTLDPITLGNDTKTQSWKTWLQLFYTNKQNILDFSLFGIDLNNASWVKIDFIYYDSEGKELFTLTTGDTGLTPIVGIRPLGLRKKGIIINPKNMNEDFQDSTDQYSYSGEIINARMNIERDAIIEDGEESGEHTIVPIQFNLLKQYTDDVIEIDGFNQNCITYKINGVKDDNGEKTYYGNWEFDGIGVKNLANIVFQNKQAIGNKDEQSGLAWDVYSNWWDITFNVKAGFNSITTHKETGTKTGLKNSTSDTFGHLSSYSDKITISNIPTNYKITSIVLSLQIQECPDADYIGDIKPPYVTDYSINNNNLEISFSGSCWARSASNNQTTFTIQADAYFIEIPTFDIPDTTSTASTFNSSSPTVTETTEEEAVEEVIEETQTEQTEVVEPETTTDGGETTE